MKIGYFYIKAGNGHYIPAKSLFEKTVEFFGTESCELVDFYNEVVHDAKTANWTRKMWSKIMLDPSRERFESWLFDNNILFCQTIHKHFLAKKYIKNFKEYVNLHKLDCIVATNCVIATIIGLLVKKSKLNVKVYYYCSDIIFSYKFAAKDKNISAFLAPSDECVKDLKSKGAKVVYKIPIPIQNQIYECSKRDKMSAKEQLGIDKNKFCLLYQLGGEGEGRFKLLELCAKNNLDVHFIVLGKLSDDTLKSLNKFKDKYSNISLTTPGFVTNVQDYVMASDLVMSQSGLNAIAESFYLSTPVLLSIVFYVGMPWDKFLRQTNTGFCKTSPRTQFELIKDLIDNPIILQNCQKNISNLSFEYGAAQGAEIVMQSLEVNNVG